MDLDVDQATDELVEHIGATYMNGTDLSAVEFHTAWEAVESWELPPVSNFLALFLLYTSAAGIDWKRYLHLTEGCEDKLELLVTRLRAQVCDDDD